MKDFTIEIRNADELTVSVAYVFVEMSLERIKEHISYMMDEAKFNPCTRNEKGLHPVVTKCED